MMIKLDSGDYINTDVVEVIAEKYVSFIGDGLTYITPADRDRIVEAINGPTVTTAQDDGLRPFTAEDFKNVRRCNE